jgi:hypothetical protein
MLFLVIDLIVSLCVASYLYSPLCDVIDTFFLSSQSVVTSMGGTSSTQTIFAWHALPILILFAVVFGSIWFLKNLISNRNNPKQ